MCRFCHVDTALMHTWLTHASRSLILSLSLCSLSLSLSRSLSCSLSCSLSFARSRALFLPYPYSHSLSHALSLCRTSSRPLALSLSRGLAGTLVLAGALVRSPLLCALPLACSRSIFLPAPLLRLSHSRRPTTSNHGADARQADLGAPRHGRRCRRQPGDLCRGLQPARIVVASGRV